MTSRSRAALPKTTRLGSSAKISSLPLLCLVRPPRQMKPESVRVRLYPSHRRVKSGVVFGVGRETECIGIDYCHSEAARPFATARPMGPIPAIHRTLPGTCRPSISLERKRRRHPCCITRPNSAARRRPEVLFNQTGVPAQRRRQFVHSLSSVPKWMSSATAAKHFNCSMPIDARPANELPKLICKNCTIEWTGFNLSPLRTESSCDCPESALAMAWCGNCERVAPTFTGLVRPKPRQDDRAICRVNNARSGGRWSAGRRMRVSARPTR